MKAENQVCQLLVADDSIKTPKMAFSDYDSDKIEIILKEAFEKEDYKNISVSKFVRMDKSLIVHYKVYSNNATIANFELLEIPFIPIE